jgi:hypothetical protein
MFGTSAVVRVGRGSDVRRTSVKVGREEGRRSASVRTGAANADPTMSGGACNAYDWSNACMRPLSIPRTSVAAGATTAFTVTPCGPYKLGDDANRVFNVPESFASLFEVTSIKVCRVDYIENNAWPLESFTSQGPGVSLGCGSVFFPSLPLTVSVKNVSGAAAFFSMLILGKELAICGQ